MKKYIGRKQSIKYDFHGESMSAYKLLQLVSEEGSLELAKGILLNTKEQLTFENEEILTNIENNLYDDPDNEELRKYYDKYQNINYKGSTYWLTDSSGKIIGCIHNSRELDAFINKKRLLSIV
jgi:hypothetical protein